jgi:molybdopterin converting factor small subunit
MPRVVFTANLQRHVPCPPCTVSGDTAGEALDRAFALAPKLKGYILDEHGELRRHMVVFVNGQPCRDRLGLSDPVLASDEIEVMQALSGG